MNSELVTQVTTFICNEILRDPNRKIGEDEPIISSGLVDSFGLVDLALFVEDTIGVRIEDVELTSSVFDTPKELADLISKRLTSSTQ